MWLRADTKLHMWFVLCLSCTVLDSRKGPYKREGSSFSDRRAAFTDPRKVCQRHEAFVFHCD